MRGILPLLVLAGVIAAAHGSAVPAGWFMDDWAHVRQLRSADWSLRGLTDACRLELVGGVIDLWWLPETTLRFFRPVSFALMKLTYVATGWSATAMHVASLAWHWLTCVLLFILLRRITAAAYADATSRVPAAAAAAPSDVGRTAAGRPISWLPLVVACLFAIHPGHVGTVQWIACQTELMVTAFLLGATLCFAVYRGWPGFQTDSAWRRGWAGVATVLCFTAALGCRENAVMLPFVLAAVEPFVARWRRGRSTTPWHFFALLLLLVVAYGFLRTHYLAGAALPPRPYVIAPTEPDFARFITDKTLYYLMCEFLLAPCVPIAGLPYLQARPALFYPAAAVVLALIGLTLWRYRHKPTGWLGAAWLLGFMAPVLPAFASPHHLYLPGVGWALLMSGLLAWPSQSARSPTARAWLTPLAASVLAIAFAITTYFSSLLFNTAQQVEDQVVREVLSTPGGLRDGDTLYFINLPMIAHYVRLAVEESGGLHDLRAVGLTWSPRILGMTSPAEVAQIDERTLTVRIGGAERYFAGPAAQLIREALGRPLGTIHTREHPRGGCVVFIEERDAEGVQALRFVLDRPLRDSAVHVYWGSRAGWAHALQPVSR